LIGAANYGAKFKIFVAIFYSSIYLWLLEEPFLQVINCLGYIYIISLFVTQIKNIFSIQQIVTIIKIIAGNSSEFKITIF